VSDKNCETETIIFIIRTSQLYNSQI